jgi:hypothetical protein
VQGKVNPAFGWNYFAGLQLLSDRSLLWSGDVFDGDKYWPAWIITDRVAGSKLFTSSNERIETAPAAPLAEVKCRYATWSPQA